MARTVARVWTMGSSSNPDKKYETLQYSDGSTSCNCKGWCIAKGGIRTCKHTKAVENGTADQMSVSHTSYVEEAPLTPKQRVSAAPKYEKAGAVAKAVTKPLPARKVLWK